MQHLTPVGLSPDGRHLVLVGDAGEEFVVEVGPRLHAALRGDNARLGQLEMKMESALRPRDIQARIRAGEPAEDVAAAAQTTVEAIMPFAGPVLAERAHVAETAVKASIRRQNSESTPAARTLDEASRQYLTKVGVRADDVVWDAWRRDDGRWALVATWAERGEPCRAVFAYDQPGRFVIAENGDARLLTGEDAPRAATPAPAPGIAERRLSAVPSVDELPLGDDALDLVREPGSGELSAPDADAIPAPGRHVQTDPVPTADLSQTAEAIRSTPADAAESDPGADPAAARAFDDLVADHADADWITESDQEYPLVDPAAPVPEPTGAEAGEEAVDVAAEEPAADLRDDAPEDPPAGRPQRTRKKGRSSVPSWDEIMFGGGGSPRD